MELELSDTYSQTNDGEDLRHFVTIGGNKTVRVVAEVKISEAIPAHHLNQVLWWRKREVRTGRQNESQAKMNNIVS